MSYLTRLACAAALALSTAIPAAAQDGSSIGFGPTAEVPDPRAGYNGWMSNQTGVTETPICSRGCPCGFLPSRC